MQREYRRDCNQSICERVECFFFIDADGDSSLSKTLTCTAEGWEHLDSTRGNFKGFGVQWTPPKRSPWQSESELVITQTTYEAWSSTVCDVKGALQQMSQTFIGTLWVKNMRGLALKWLLSVDGRNAKPLSLQYTSKRPTDQKAKVKQDHY